MPELNCERIYTQDFEKAAYKLKAERKLEFPITVSSKSPYADDKAVYLRRRDKQDPELVLFQDADVQRIIQAAQKSCMALAGRRVEEFASKQDRARLAKHFKIGFGKAHVMAKCMCENVGVYRGRKHLFDLNSTPGKNFTTRELAAKLAEALKKPLPPWVPAEKPAAPAKPEVPKPEAPASAPAVSAEKHCAVVASVSAEAVDTCRKIVAICTNPLPHPNAPRVLVTQTTDGAHTMLTFRPTDRQECLNLALSLPRLKLRLLGGGAAPGAASGAPPTREPLASDDETRAMLRQQMIEEVNRTRSEPHVCGKKGRFGPAGKVVWDSLLEEAALSHARNMAKQGILEHTLPGGSSFKTRIHEEFRFPGEAAENLGRKQMNVRELVDGWLGSEGHCVNLMNPTYTEIGAALAIASDKGKKQPYWTLILGKRRQ